MKTVLILKLQQQCQNTPLVLASGSRCLSQRMRGSKLTPRLFRNTFNDERGHKICPLLESAVQCVGSCTTNTALRTVQCTVYIALRTAQCALHPCYDYNSVGRFHSLEASSKCWFQSILPWPWQAFKRGIFAHFFCCCITNQAYFWQMKLLCQRHYK